MIKHKVYEVTDNNIKNAYDKLLVEMESRDKFYESLVAQLGVNRIYFQDSGKFRFAVVNWWFNGDKNPENFNPKAWKRKEGYHLLPSLRSNAGKQLRDDLEKISIKPKYKIISDFIEIYIPELNKYDPNFTKIEDRLFISYNERHGLAVSDKLKFMKLSEFWALQGE